MLKTMWLSSIMTVTFNWIFSRTFSPVIESPRIPAPLSVLLAVVMAVTIWRWTIQWKHRHTGPSALAASPSLIAARPHLGMAFLHDLLQMCVPHWLQSHIPTGRP